MKKKKEVVSKTESKLDKETAEDLAKEATKDHSLLHGILDGVYSSHANVKFKCAKALSIISKNEPRMLYPKFDFFIDLLDGESKVLKWNAIDVVANLASVDVNKRFEKIFEKFYSLLHEGSLITAAHVVGNSGVIVNAQPNLESRITSELLKVENLELPTDECRNVLLGHTIVSLDQYFDEIQNKVEVISLVRRQLNNSRKATKVKAEEFLRKHYISP